MGSAPKLARDLHVLALPDSFPSRSNPHGGVFIFRQLAELVRNGAVVQAVRPVEWAPPGRFAPLWPGGRETRRGEHDNLAWGNGVGIVTQRFFQPAPSRLFPGDTFDRQADAIARAVRRGRLCRPDVVYGCFLSTGGYLATLIGQRLGVPSVAIARGDDVHLWPRRWEGHRRRLEHTLTHGDRLLACAQALATDAVQWCPPGTQPPRFDVVYNGVDLERFSPPTRADADVRMAAPPTGTRRLLAIGSANRAKGWLELLDAWSELATRHTAWVLRIVAPYGGGEPVELSVEIARRGLGDRVELSGAVHPDAMAALYRQCDAFVSASHDEGLSNSLLEAMASGLACVATRVGGHEELIVDAQCGTLVPRSDAQALVDAVDRVLGSDEVRATIGAGARAAAVRIGSAVDNADVLYRLLVEAASRRAAL